MIFKHIEGFDKSLNEYNKKFPESKVETTDDVFIAQWFFISGKEFETKRSIKKLEETMG